MSQSLKRMLLDIPSASIRQFTIADEAILAELPYEARLAIACYLAQEEGQEAAYQRGKEDGQEEVYRVAEDEAAERVAEEISALKKQIRDFISNI